MITPNEAEEIIRDLVCKAHDAVELLEAEAATWPKNMRTHDRLRWLSQDLKYRAKRVEEMYKWSENSTTC